MALHTKAINRIIKVKEGELRGVPGNNPAYTVFKGVPFAKTPVGEYRFLEAQAPDPWEGVLNCDKFAPISIQQRWEEGAFYQKEFYADCPPMSEDCLYLNIWTRDTERKEKLPILFWIHGGGNVHGYSYEITFDGEEMLKRGCILITTSYRLGLFGWFAHPELTKKNGTSGNYGLSDCIQALSWVKENAEAFGGDPDNITIFGQSAGGGLTKNLIMSKKARGLFNRAIIQSSGQIGKPGMTATLADKEKIGKEAVDSLALTVDDLMGEDANTLYEKLTAAITARGAFSPCVDGYFMDKGVCECFMSGDYGDIDVMMGCVTGDNSLFGRDGVPMTERIAEFGAEAINSGHKPNYLYHFDRQMTGDDAGAFHSAELWYMFGTLNRCWRYDGFTSGDWQLSNAMLDYWCSFAKCGDPNNAKQPTWPPYTIDDPSLIYMNEKEISIKNI